MLTMTIYMDPAVDAVGIEFESVEVGHSKRLDDYRIVDYSANPGEPVGVSLHNVSEGVVTKGLPKEDLVRGILHVLGVQTK